MTERTFDVDLTAMTYGGDALGRLPDGRAVFVPYALPGERVRVALVDEKRSFARARLEEVLQPAPQRVAARCPHYTICGGCHYQHLGYEDQLAVKPGWYVSNLSALRVFHNREYSQLWHHRRPGVIAIRYSFT